MFCVKCGNKINNDIAKYCPKCGCEINGSKLHEDIHGQSKEDSDEDQLNSYPINEFVLFPKMNQLKREKLNYWILKGKEILEGIVGLIIIAFIWDEIQAGENYKLIIYIIRFINELLPYLLLVRFYEEFCKLIILEKNQISKDCSVNKIIISKIIFVIICILAGNMLTMESDANAFKMFSVLLQDNFIMALIEYISIMIIPFLMFIISSVWNRYNDKNLLCIEDDES